MLESELFGHEKGAFTGAIAARQGCFERASGGTLLLDEIGDISPEFQAKLLRVLQEGEVLRVGGSEPRRINVRVVAATNSSLQDKVAAGRFREDLYFRLNVIPIQLLPLRERREDILALARNFLARMAAEAGRQMTLDSEAAEMLLRHSWPGNVRELENAIERAVVLTRADAITAADLMLDRVGGIAAGFCGERRARRQVRSRAGAGDKRGGLAGSSARPHWRKAETSGLANISTRRPASESRARWPRPRAIGPRPHAASGSAARRCTASCGGWVTSRSASGARNEPGEQQ